MIKQGIEDRSGVRVEEVGGEELWGSLKSSLDHIATVCPVADSLSALVPGRYVVTPTEKRNATCADEYFQL